MIFVLLVSCTGFALRKQRISAANPLRSQQALVEGEQRLVDLKHIVIPMLNEIRNDDVKFV